MKNCPDFQCQPALESIASTLTYYSSAFHRWTLAYFHMVMTLYLRRFDENIQFGRFALLDETRSIVSINAHLDFCTTNVNETFFICGNWKAKMFEFIFFWKHTTQPKCLIRYVYIGTCQKQLQISGCRWRWRWARVKRCVLVHDSIDISRNVTAQHKPSENDGKNRSNEIQINRRNAT